MSVFFPLYFIMERDSLEVAVYFYMCVLFVCVDKFQRASVNVAANV